VRSGTTRLVELHGFSPPVAYFRMGVVAPDWPSELGVVELVAPCALPEP
jgi:hypothetical protein